MKALLILATIVLASCASGPKNVEPKPVDIVVAEKVVTKTVPVTSGLTMACYNESAKEATAREAKRLALVRLASLEECTRRMCRIANLGRASKLDCDAKDISQLVKALGQAQVSPNAL